MAQGTDFRNVRGMRDLLPAETPRWQRIETAAIEVLTTYGYEELRLPLLEDTALFKRGVGEATDVVEKEMFSFVPQQADETNSITLRPEGTASTVRALQQHGLLYNQTQRVWYNGPMFRYERPQKGRYRQFYQIGAEVFGLPQPAVEAELILMCRDLFERLGLLDHVELQLNTLGSGSARVAYRDALTSYFAPLTEQLDDDSVRRLDSNPLRILDSKVPSTQALVADAPKLPDFVDAQAKEHFAELRALLDGLGVAYRLNDGLVRGLDYYTHTVFEWVTERLGAQGTVCGGGRYDGLVGLLGGKDTPGAGFAIGIDRMVLLHEAVHADSQADSQLGGVDAYIVVADPQHMAWCLNLANKLRAPTQGSERLRVRTHLGGGKLKAQMKKADASGARLALIVGNDEVAADQVSVKYLREHAEQVTVAVAELPAFIGRYVSTG